MKKTTLTVFVLWCIALMLPGPILTVLSLQKYMQGAQVEAAGHGALAALCWFVAGGVAYAIVRGEKLLQ